MTTPHLAVPVGPADHAQGPADARVTLLVYGDYECPFTRRARTVVRAVQERATTPFRYVFRNFPLKQHPHAFRAAEAAEAAAVQGKFWEMHHLLFDNPSALEDEHLAGYGTKLALDESTFTRALARNTYAPHIRADQESGLLSGVRGTPTFFVNGVFHADLEDDPERLLAALQA